MLMYYKNHNVMEVIEFVDININTDGNYLVIILIVWINWIYVNSNEACFLIIYMIELVDTHAIYWITVQIQLISVGIATRIDLVNINEIYFISIRIKVISINISINGILKSYSHRICWCQCNIDTIYWIIEQRYLLFVHQKRRDNV